MIKNVYVVKLGKVYLCESGDTFLGLAFYKMVNILSRAKFFELDEAKKVAEEIGGEICKIALEEFEE